MAEQLSAIVEEAASTEPVADEIRALAERLSPERVEAALAHAFEVHEVDGATVLALAMLAQGTPPPAEAVERVFPDSISDRASQVLVASHPDALTILERMLGSRKLDRYQLASASALYTHLHPEPPWPPALLETLRTLARARPGWVGEDWARHAALRVRDPHLDELYGLDRDREKPDPKLFEELGDDPGIDSLPASRSNVIASGFTARRATPKVGRNDPCPCGSGKKYKKCCAGKERSQSWSPVAGLTMREYRRRLHEFLDARRMLREHPADLARLPLTELATDQLDACFTVFLDCERMDDAERALALLAERDLGDELTVDDLRAELVTYAHDWGHDELVSRHLERFEDEADIPRHVVLGRALRRPTESTLSLLERECRPHFVDGQPPPMVLAYELIEPYPALGAIMARGCLDPTLEPDSRTLLAEIEWARDRLGAPPEDAYQNVWESMVDERRLEKVADEEKEALRAELERMRVEARDARAEAHVLVRELGKHRSQLDELETKATEAERRSKTAKSAAEREAAERDREAARRLRLKIRELEGRIREGQHERAELRRKAEELASQQAEGEDAGEEREPSVEERSEAAIPHGVRVPVWSDKARGSLDKLPKNVTSSAIATAGMLGAGRPEAWRHAKRLEGMHGLCSARVGIHHRLLFRMDDEGLLDVDEVVTREDLDRALAARR
ncbi:MAG TPA: SEC-C metal-binding domain-containing protein [Sandaracinaceae bacterium LLY-WYZ-13_1]|nr:SEC-C metal-binding domain-containing protein [Sandaracinaceae bacterium LLY-WYZ-13_1]